MSSLMLRQEIGSSMLQQNSNVATLEFDVATLLFDVTTLIFSVMLTSADVVTLI